MTIAVHLGTDHRAPEDHRDCYWLYVVTNCNTKPTLQGPIKDPARIAWHEVIKVQHYWLEVDAIMQPMGVEQSPAQYSGSKEDK